MPDNRPTLAELLSDTLMEIEETAARLRELKSEAAEYLAAVSAAAK